MAVTTETDSGRQLRTRTRAAAATAAFAPSVAPTSSAATTRRGVISSGGVV
ncbi:hypothetical protein BV898_19074, partial [Hypsibius exemplaris]